MFPPAGAAAAVDCAPVGQGGAVDLDLLLEAVGNLDGNASDAVLIDRIADLERLKAGCAAAQARLTATFAASQTAAATARGHRPDAARRSVAGQVGLARRDSPHAGRRHVGVATALVGDMPHTLAALGRGDLSERRARIVVEQLACLTPEHRREADRLLAGELPSMGDRTAETRAAAVAYRLDPETVMGKIRGAVKDRHVSVRPAPDAMSRLSALLPVSLGVAVYAALAKAATAATAMPGGDPRNRGQLMADALVSAVTGRHVTGCDPYGVPQYGPAQAAAEETPAAATERSAQTADSTPSERSATQDPATNRDSRTAATTASTGPGQSTVTTAAATATAAGTCSGGCGISINLIMTDRTLLDGDDEPAHLQGHGPIPAALARALVIGAADTATGTWIRRLYTDPRTTQLITMDPGRRLFPPAAQRFLLARDQTCRTPWCDAPIRHADHIHPHAAGGPTTLTNGRGLCLACNLTAAAPAWHATTNHTDHTTANDATANDDTGGTDGTVTTTTPTGHTYPSRAPTPPRSTPWPATPWADVSTLEGRIVELLLAA